MNALLVVPAFVWLIVSGLFYATGEYLSKKFALAPSWQYAVAIVLVYGVTSLVWLPAIWEKNQLSTTGLLWSVIGILMTVAIGVFFFGERPNAIGVIGIAFAVLAVGFLSAAY